MSDDIDRMTQQQINLALLKRLGWNAKYIATIHGFGWVVVPADAESDVMAEVEDSAEAAWLHASRFFDDNWLHHHNWLQILSPYFAALCPVDSPVQQQFKIWRCHAGAVVVEHYSPCRAVTEAVYRHLLTQEQI